MHWFLALTMAVSMQAAEDLRVGRAAVVITPEAGVPLAGYYSTRFANGVHDDLQAKAIVIATGDRRVALVACDLIGLPPAVLEEARRIAAAKSGIPEGNIMISATHTHTGPLMMGGGARDAAYGGTLPAAQKYLSELPSKIAESITSAVHDLQPAKMSAGRGQETSISFNRRFFMKDGSVGWNAGKLNPNIVRPAGPVDPDVSVLYFENASTGEALATYVNFALHLDTVGGQEISADYPATLSSILSKVKGPRMLTVFTNAACGNINHIDVSTKRPQKGNEEAAQIGTVLAGEVIKTYARLEPAAPVTANVRSRTLALPPAAIQSGDQARARQIATSLESGGKATFLDTVFAYKVLDVVDRKGKAYDAEVQVVALTRDIAIVALPGEIFTELGMAIKKSSPFPMTIVVELAHGPTTYFPNEAAVPQGNYEVVTSRVAAGSGERLVDAAQKLLAEAHAAQR
ncbi:MAG: neutral/alkaline non-lysosomal ceramidase N-terminal domain-containing protein [Bryobacteraceae bacterium]|nr:neutral/alkaline non-lysosomal ceramidase N-terminal domain-containing protein [Bryobacteraceae bacterium]